MTVIIGLPHAHVVTFLHETRLHIAADWRLHGHSRLASAALSERLVGCLCGLIVGAYGVEVLLGYNLVLDKFCRALVFVLGSLVGDGGLPRRVVLQFVRRNGEHRRALAHRRAFGHAAHGLHYACHGGNDGGLVALRRQYFAAAGYYSAELARHNRLDDYARSLGLFGVYYYLVGMSCLLLGACLGLVAVPVVGFGVASAVSAGRQQQRAACRHK